MQTITTFTHATKEELILRVTTDVGDTAKRRVLGQTTVLDDRDGYSCARTYDTLAQAQPDIKALEELILEDGYRVSKVEKYEHE